MKRGRRPASLHDDDLVWFDSDARAEYDSARTPAMRVLRVSSIVLITVLAVLYVLAAFTLTGALVGGATSSVALMYLAAFATLVLPGLLWLWLRSRYFRPRLTVILAIINGLYVVLTIVIAPRMTGRVIEARGNWWITSMASAFGAENSPFVKGTTDLLVSLARGLHKMPTVTVPGLDRLDHSRLRRGGAPPPRAPASSPEAPAAPTKPGTAPAVPTKSGTPPAPTKPATPATPATSAKPATPATPATAVPGKK